LIEPSALQLCGLPPVLEVTGLHSHDGLKDAAVVSNDISMHVCCDDLQTQDTPLGQYMTEPHGVAWDMHLAHQGTAIMQCIACHTSGLPMILPEAQKRLLCDGVANMHLKLCSVFQ
jgi:hypothetical protein